MASTFSTTLRLELIGDGDQSGIWGQTTNTNLGSLIEQAITGVQSITMTDANYTLTSFNGVVDEARNAVLVVGGTNAAVRDIIAPLVEKLYVIKNSTVGGFGIRIIGSSGTGVTVPSGATVWVYCDGTNFNAINTESVGNFEVNGNLTTTGTANITGLLTGTTATFSGAISSVSPAFTGTPTAPTAANGTSTTQIATTAFVNAAVTSATGALGTMSTQNANNVSITGGTITGITDLAVADGGTGSSSLAANNVLLGNGTSALQVVAPGTSGNVLTSNGTTWTSTAVPGGLGVGQTWTNVSGSRAFSTSYTNSTGKPIVVAIVASQTPGGSWLGATVDGVGPIPMGTGYTSGGTYTVSGTVVIPVGATYSVAPQITAGSVSLSSWYELR